MPVLVYFRYLRWPSSGGTMSVGPYHVGWIAEYISDCSQKGHHHEMELIVPRPLGVAGLAGHSQSERNG